jgi:acyl-CoA reductase-like NAD-dependent aldehyde dehydrogenase
MTWGATFQLKYFAGLATTCPFETQQPSSRGSGTATIVRELVGVVAAIAPWNAPHGIMAQKIGPALVAGCKVIMKPSPETPPESYVIAVDRRIGQVCATLSRVIVPRAKQCAFAEAFAEATPAIRVGDPADPGTQMGPLARNASCITCRVTSKKTSSRELG